MAEKPNHHTDRLLVLDRHGPNSVERIEESRGLDERQRAPVRVMKAGRGADALVFLANTDQPELRIVGDWKQQTLAGVDVRHRKHELDPTVLDGGKDGRAVQFNLGLLTPRSL